MRVSIIGSGVAGARIAKYLAEKGYRVDVFEMKPVVGKPVACTGIVSRNVAQYIDFLDDILVNKVCGADFHSANEYFELETEKTQAYIIERDQLDVELKGEAETAGARFHLQHRFIEKQNNNILVEHKGQKRLMPADILIGSDGPLSVVARDAGLWQKRQFLQGIQFRILGHFNPSKVSLHLGSTCPGFFAWIVPESQSVARVGVAAKNNAKVHFNNFLARLNQESPVKKIGIQSGLIPIHKPCAIEKGNTFLIGDAALQTKNTTGGGIVMSLKAAELLAESITKNKSYTALCRKHINKNLFYHRVIRSMFNRFDDTKYDKLLAIMKKDKNTETLTTFGDMDYLCKLFYKLVLKEPRLLSLLF